MDACVEVKFVEAFESSISSMEASVGPFVETSEEVNSVKASITFSEKYITSMKAYIEVFVEVTFKGAFVEA